MTDQSRSYEINTPDPARGTNPASAAPRGGSGHPAGHTEAGARGARCTAACRKPSPSMAHCATCHRTFGGVTGFDRHRRGGQCVDPQTLGMVEHNDIWRNPMDLDARERMRPTGGAA